MNKSCNKSGMTLTEMLLAVTILGMLALLLIPAISLAVRSRENAECARKIQTAVQAFNLYGADTGEYPPDQNVPGETSVPAMEDYYFPYFKIDWWGDETELGGRWDWDVEYHGFRRSVSICNPTVSSEQLTEFDRLIDDGNLNTGRFRKSGTQYHYILEQ